VVVVVVVAIASAENLTNLSLLNDVAGRITGLFLYGCQMLDRSKMEIFFSKLVNLESLTLVYCSPIDMYREDGIFLKTIFSGGMISKLKFVETDAITDDAIAEMSTCPDLSNITFTYPSVNITNDGIQRLVDAGGGKELQNVSAGTMKKHLSKSLTMKYIAATLPKLANVPEYQAHQHLSHMVKGTKKKSAYERLLEKHAAEDSKPFAVVPPERMNYSQLDEALKRRGVTRKGGKRKNTEDLRSMFVIGEVKWTYEEELDFQNRDKLKHLQEQLERLRSYAASADGDVKKLSSGNIGRYVSKLYPLLCASNIESALRETDVSIPRDASRRRDERAQLLHNSGYQGGGGIGNQLGHYKKVSTERYEEVAEKESEIQTLCQQMDAKRVRAAAVVSSVPAPSSASTGGGGNNNTVTIAVMKTSKDARLGLGIAGVAHGATQHMKITSVAPTSMFRATALQAGMILESINGTKYASFEEGCELIKMTKGQLVLVASLPTSDPKETSVPDHKNPSSESATGKRKAASSSDTSISTKKVLIDICS